ncbi:MAG: nitroreductase family protein [Spirochaetales bacterium]|nr:nitroreductase family protein [Spirochaetales bacterium]
MTVEQAIEKRRAYRLLKPVDITDHILEQLSRAAQLAPSCYNNQPWRFIFIKTRHLLNKIFEALSPGNAWGKKASLIIVVYGKKEDDCVIKEREYYLFDLGLAVSAILLQATELELVAHPIAGFSPQKVKETTGIPGEYTVITLIIIGARDKNGDGESEEKRPERHPLSEIYYIDTYKEKNE